MSDLWSFWPWRLHVLAVVGFCVALALAAGERPAWTWVFAVGVLLEAAAAAVYFAWRTEGR